MKHLNPLGTVYVSKYVYYDKKYRNKVRKAIPFIWDGICFFESKFKFKKTPTVVLERFKNNRSAPFIYGKTYSNGIIRIDPAFAPEIIYNALCHEIVHFNQIQKGDLKWEGQIVYWKGERMDCFSTNAKENFLSYKEAPWETEAFAMEEVLLTELLSRSNCS